MEWLKGHPWVAFAVIYVLLAYVYIRVFRARKLPILKEAVVFLLLGLGAFILLIFQIDMDLPIIYSLGAAVSLLFIVRVRYWMLGKGNRKA